MRRLALALAAALAVPAAAHADVSFAPYFTVDGGQSPLGNAGYVATGDFNQDGDPDLAVARRSGGDVAVMLGGPGATFGQLTAFDVDGAPIAITVGDFDGNGDPDLATVDPNTDNVSVLLGSVGGAFVGSGPYSVGGDFNAVGLTSGNLDPDSDSDPEIVTAHAFGRNVSVLPGATGGTFGTAEPHALAGSNNAVYDPIIRDLNGDGDPEIVVSGDDTEVFVGRAGRTFDAATPVDASGPVAGRAGLAAADFDSDGDPDLAVGRQNFRDVVALRGAAGATFGAPNSLGFLNTVGGTPEHLEIADLDGDGDPDIAETVGNVWVMVGGAGASFAAPVEFPTDTASSSVDSADVDQDGDLDLVLGSFNSTAVGILLGQPAPGGGGSGGGGSGGGGGGGGGGVPGGPAQVLDDMGLPALTDGDVGVKANVLVVKGTVLLGLQPGAATARHSGRASQKGIDFQPLTAPRQIPIGSFLDTRRGTVRLRTATGSQNATQSGDFSGGLFQILQSSRSSARGLTELRLKGGSFGRSRCRARGSSAGARAAALSRRTIRRVRSNATGRFRTRGRNAAATVRGTIWDTTDRCDGTLTKVKRGTVVVRDFRRRKNITVRAGKRTKGPGGGRGSYLARAG